MNKKVKEEMNAQVSLVAKMGNELLMELRKKGFLREMAKTKRLYYEELIEMGFNNEQAMKIVTETELTPETALTE